MNLIYDDATHIYTLDGERLISVTGLLDSFGLRDRSHDDPVAAARGREVHRAIHYLNDDDLDCTSLDPAIEGYVAAYRKFVKETNFKPYIHEHKLASRRYHFAGTLDLLGWAGEDFTLIDIKTGAHVAVAEIQLELYWMLLRENQNELGIDVLPARKNIIQLRVDGTYKIPARIIPLQEIKVLTASILNLNQFRVERGIQWQRTLN